MTMTMRNAPCNLSYWLPVHLCGRLRSFSEPKINFVLPRAHGRHPQRRKSSMGEKQLSTFVAWLSGEFNRKALSGLLDFSEIGQLYQSPRVSGGGRFSRKIQCICFFDTEKSSIASQEGKLTIRIDTSVQHGHRQFCNDRVSFVPSPILF